MPEPFDLAPLGRSGLAVSRLGLGTVPIGGLYTAVEEDEALAVVQRAVELGVNLIDTAPVYGYGLAETRLGQVLPDLPRGDLVLATKVGRLMRADAAPDPALMRDGQPIFAGGLALNPVWDFSYDGVLRSLEESLERLRVDRVDVLHIHDPDEHHDAALSGAYRALADLRRQGVIRAVGAGMTQSEMLARFALEADFDCFLLAGRYTLLEQGALAELLPLCEQRGIGVIVGGVYNSGILARPEPDAPYEYDAAPAAVLERVRRLAEVCARHGVPLAAAAIQFPFGHPAVASVLTGVRSVAELEHNVAMLRWPVPGSLWEELAATGLLDPSTPVPARA
jgi:D-threo-aldose 1-dehydrogenase